MNLDRMKTIINNILKQEFEDRIREIKIEHTDLKNLLTVSFNMSYFNDDDMVKIVTRITRIMWMITKWSIRSNLQNELLITFYITHMDDD